MDGEIMYPIRVPRKKRYSSFTTATGETLGPDADMVEQTPLVYSRSCFQKWSFVSLLLIQNGRYKMRDGP